ncbi:MAG: YhcH/YjgK/YiaL family protein [Ferruginibacter sp.]
MKSMLFKNCWMLLLAIALVTVGTNCNSTKMATDLSGQDAKWFKSMGWLNGLQILPHESVNQQEFYRQYHLNKLWWDEAFEFLKTHDLNTIADGKYMIDSGNVFATVSTLDPNSKEKTNWEAHKDFNDLQYIISGKAMMGVASTESPNSIVSVPYDAKKDVANFTVTGEKYYDAVPGKFYIFSPHEIHRPGFKVAGYNEVKKIVIKVRVPK